MGKIDGAVATNTAAAWASKAVSPFVNFFIKVVESSFLPGVKKSLAFTSNLAELGDMAVAMALKENLPARRALPVVALSGSIPRLPVQAAVLPAVIGPSASFVAPSVTPSAAASAAANQEGQKNWRYCTKCQALVYGGSAGGHPCPNGGTRATAGSADYWVPNSRAAKPNEQNSWRYCSRCSGLYHDGVGLGRCPAGGAHAQGTVWYILGYQ